MISTSKRVAIGAVLATAALVAGCGGGDDTTSSAGNPEDAVQAFFDATKAKDASAACAVLTADSQKLAAGQEDSCEASFDKSIDDSSIPDSIEVGDAKVDGDTAIVPATGDGEKTEFTVVQEDGSWKIDLTAPPAATSTASPDATSGATDSTTG